MQLKKFNSTDFIEINNIGELRQLLKYCNPSMMRHYKSQIKKLYISNFGESIKIDKVENEY